MRASPAETIGFGSELVAEAAARPKPILRLVPRLVALEGSIGVSADELCLPLDGDPVTQETLTLVDEGSMEGTPVEEAADETAEPDRENRDAANVNCAKLTGKLAMRRFGGRGRRGSRGSRGGCAACSNTTESFPGSRGRKGGCSSCQSKSGGQAMPDTLAA